MVRICGESAWLYGPFFADSFVRGEALEGLQPLGEVVGVEELIEVLLQLFVGGVVEAPDSGFLQRSVHSLDLTVGPRMVGLGQSVLDVVLGAGILEGMGPEDLTAVHGLADQRRCGCDVAGRGEVDAVIGEHGVDPIRHRFQQSSQEVGGDTGGGTFVQLDEGKLAG